MDSKDRVKMTFTKEGKLRSPIKTFKVNDGTENVRRSNHWQSQRCYKKGLVFYEYIN